jgi:hypothetical protein
MLRLRRSVLLIRRLRLEGPFALSTSPWQPTLDAVDNGRKPAMRAMCVEWCHSHPLESARRAGGRFPVEKKISRFLAFAKMHGRQGPARTLRFPPSTPTRRELRRITGRTETRPHETSYIVLYAPPLGARFSYVAQGPLRDRLYARHARTAFGKGI